MTKIINGVASEYEFPPYPQGYNIRKSVGEKGCCTPYITSEKDINKQKIGEDETKQLILVRKDLKMQQGKLAAQVAHASLMSFLNACSKKQNKRVTSYEVFAFSCEEEWLNNASTKVVLAVKNENQLLKYQKIAEENAIPNALITDLGRTCFNNQETVTCLGIGPFDNETLDTLFKRLQLYK